MLVILRALGARHLEEFARTRIVTSLAGTIKMCKQKIMFRMHNRWASQSLVGPLSKLAQIYVSNPRVKEKRRCTDGSEREYSGVMLVHVLYEHVLSKIGERYELSEENQYELRLWKEGITPVVLSYAKFLRHTCMPKLAFRQYYSICNPPGASMEAQYQVGKSLLSPTQHECNQDRTLAKEYLERAMSRGHLKAAYRMGCYAIDVLHEFDSGLDLVLTSFRMGYYPALDKFVRTVDKMGGPRRDPNQHFLLLVEGRLQLQKAIAGGGANSQHLERLKTHLERCNARLKEAVHVKRQFKRGLRLYLSNNKSEEAREWMEVARDNGRPGMMAFWGPPRLEWPGHKCRTTKYFTLYEEASAPYPCEICGREMKLPARKCLSCKCRVCMECCGGLFPEKGEDDDMHEVDEVIDNDDDDM
jgi:hypothetical protein